MPTKEYQKWLQFLAFVNDEPANRDMITAYFFEKFAPAPKLFYDFILFFKKKLQAKKTRSQRNLAQKYLTILSPLCERFGFIKEKSLLDDICFKITQPKEYEKLDRLLAKYKQKSRRVITKILGILKEILDAEEKYEYELKGRYKNLYSIWVKMRKKGKKSVLDLNDIFAFRIIIENNSTEQCFEVVNLLHDRFSPMAKFFKDYITIPKINGYQSLHTGLNNIVPNLDLPVEVQVRTRIMNDFAKKGLATHWLYAMKKKAELISAKEKKLLHYLSGIGTTSGRQKSIYFFSYKGDIFKMDEGATVLDFAYRIHTDIGNRTSSAVVNGRKRTPFHILHEGDQVKINKSRHLQVSSDWLSHVKTRHAANKIKGTIRP